MDQVLVRNISMEYGYEDDMKNSNIFTVREDEAKEIFAKVVVLLEEYSFTNCRLTLGDRYKTEDKNINTKEEVEEYLVKTFESLKAQRKALKLTN